MVFRTAVRLPRGGIKYEMENREQAALLSKTRVAKAFEQGFGDVSCRGQGAVVLLQCAPVTWCPEEPEAVRSLERENKLEKGDILAASWVKPVHKRGPNQTKAVVRLDLRSQELADRLITEGGQLEYSPVNFRKEKQEPIRCLKCQRYGHKAVKCKTSQDTCSQCGGAHRSAQCDMRNLKHCVSCNAEDHCSYERSCPTFRAECARFNQRRPENASRFYDTTKTQVPFPMPNRPIHHPAVATLADAMAPLNSGWTVQRGARPAPFVHPDRRNALTYQGEGQARKSRHVSEEWNIPGVITPPRVVPAHVHRPASTPPRITALAPVSAVVPIPVPVVAPVPIVVATPIGATYAQNDTPVPSRSVSPVSPGDFVRAMANFFLPNTAPVSVTLRPVGAAASRRSSTSSDATTVRE